MPKGAGKLDDATIETLTCWVKVAAQHNRTFIPNKENYETIIAERWTGVV